MAKTLGWGSHTDELLLLSEEIIELKQINIKDLQNKLQLILGPKVSVEGVDLRLIAFLEFLFLKSQGPYSPDFTKYSLVIQSIIRQSGTLKNMLNKTGSHAIGNMVLNGRRKLKFTISDFYELQYVLDFWEGCGLEKQTPRSIFNAILKKKGISEQIQNKDPSLLVRLSSVFPMFEKEIISADFNLISIRESPQNPFVEYYESIIKYHTDQGLTLEGVIQLENLRQRNPIEKRNSFLVYLVKKQQNFQCQLCKTGCTTKDPSFIEVHHIVPLSKRGEDLSSNMLVTCNFHHKDIHEGRILIEKSERIAINCGGEQFYTKAN